ncbi:MAG: SpoIIIAH-like family protein [Candidatus Ventricola sp.]
MARWVRAAGCAVLVALLAVCSYLGARQPVAQTVSVPVAVEMISESALSAASLEETQDRLQRERENALALLQSVIDDQSAGAEARDEALREKTALAKRMAAEAEITAILAQMGFGDAAVVLGEESASVIVPWQAAENEQNRVRLIDAAASHTGLSPECIKIILSKK